MVAQTFGVFDLVLDSIAAAVADVTATLADLSALEIGVIALALLALWRLFSIRR